MISTLLQNLSAVLVFKSIKLTGFYKKVLHITGTIWTIEKASRLFLPVLLSVPVTDVKVHMFAHFQFLHTYILGILLITYVI